jgi:hypothetical protein
VGRLDLRLARLENAADAQPERVSYKAMLDRAWAIKARLRKWSKSQLYDYRARLAEATKAVARDKSLPPHDGTYKATLERAKAIQVELNKRNHEEK